MEETIIMTDALASDVGAAPSVYISCSFHFEFVLQVFELRRGGTTCSVSWWNLILDALIKLKLNWDLTVVSMHAKGNIIDC